MQSVRHVLRHWPAAAASDVYPLESALQRSHFSGAELWRVAAPSGDFCLRAWPKRGPNAETVRVIHQLQTHLGATGPQITPIPAQSSSGDTLVAHEGRLWELSTWRPGAADPSDNPPVERLEAACDALAQVHLAASECSCGRDRSSDRLAPSPAMERRAELARRMLAGQLAELLATMQRISESELRRTLVLGLRLAASQLPAIHQRLLQWVAKPLPLQWRLTDVRQQHVLFTGSKVTGLIDFGAAAVDSPAGDLARLLGEVAGGDSERLQIGFQAYERRRPLLLEEKAAVDLFDVSGACLSVCNWAIWISEEPALLGERSEAAILARVQQLVRRLQIQEKSALPRID